MSNIRTNFYLWLLTGRVDDYANASLNNGVRYVVDEIPDDVNAIRDLLKLRDTRTDFHVLGALAPVYASTSLLRQMPKETDAVFRGGLLVPPPVSSTAELLPSGGSSWPVIDGAAAGSLDFTQVTFSYLNDSEVSITTDNGIADTSPYEAVSADGQVRLSIAKADDYGIKADFLVASWEVATSPVVVTVAPSQYPYTEVSKVISRSTAAINLMTAEGTMQAFAETSNPAIKVGLLSIAVIRRMIKQLNEDHQP